MNVILHLKTRVISHILHQTIEALDRKLRLIANNKKSNKYQASENRSQLITAIYDTLTPVNIINSIHY